MILDHSGWERFAQLVASGERGAAAYRSCYRARGASAEVGASRLLRNVKVSRRIAELKEAAATGAVMTLHERRVWLARVVRANIFMLDPAKDGDLIQEITSAEGSGGKITRIKFPSKPDCIMLDARLAGDLRGNALTVNVQGNGSAPGYVLTEERRMELVERRRRATFSLEDTPCK